jgi:hypothetical protein
VYLWYESQINAYFSLPIAIKKIYIDNKKAVYYLKLYLKYLKIVRKKIPRWCPINSYDTNILPS